MASKITKKFTNAIPPYGYIGEIAKIVGCSRQTVSKHLHDPNSVGYYADRIRKIYLSRYCKEK